jgi:hypothetical protein
MCILVLVSWLVVKAVRGVGEGVFGFRVRFGDFEVEVSGSREEVLRTVEMLPGLIVKVREAFEGLEPREKAKITVRTEAPKAEEKIIVQGFPKIAPTENCAEAVLRILESDWGKWRPRTVDELKKVLVANGLNFPGRVLSAALLGLVRKGTVRRWNTNAGYVYILAEKEVLGV